MDPKVYKRLHENYMKNNNGTTIEETFTTIVPTFFTTFLTINLILVSRPGNNLGKFAIEFILIVFTQILNVTILHYKIWEIAATLLIICGTAVGKQLYQKTHIAPFVRIPSKRPQFISIVRAVINLITSVCILAVDFKCFPRKLAKTETYGFGLMDTGVGLYVYGNGIIAPELFKTADENKLTIKKLKMLLIGCTPLFVLGLARFFVTNEIDYQQHISEYGVHWNFFLTLAITKIIGTIILSILPKIEYAKYVAIAIMTVHELLLQLGLAIYVIDDKGVSKRDNFFNANREGIISIPGYISLYLASVYIGHMLKISNAEEDKTSEKEKSLKNLENTVNVRQMFMNTMRLLIISLVIWKISYVLRNMFGVSRRLANMGYVIWILSIGASMTSLFMLLEIFYYFLSFDQVRSTNEDDEDNAGGSSSYIPMILDSINYNGLAFFLGANLLTGLVNLTFQTLLMSTSEAMLILGAYMFVLCAISAFLYVNKIKLKAW